jgi:hypothetical protein
MAKSHISNKASGVSTLQAKVYYSNTSYLVFTVYYWFNLTKYFVNVM